MARKLEPNERNPQPQAPAGADDLAVLLPDVPIELAGRKLTVREYRFMQGMQVRAKAKPLIDDLAAFVATGNADAGLEDYVELLAKHAELVRELMVESVEGADAAFIDGLNEGDGETLLMTWWGVCGRFFVQVVAARLRDRLLAQLRRNAASAGPTSSARSPLPDMAAFAASVPTTPSVN